MIFFIPFELGIKNGTVFRKSYKMKQKFSKVKMLSYFLILSMFLISNALMCCTTLILRLLIDVKTGTPYKNTFIFLE